MLYLTTASAFFTLGMLIGASMVFERWIATIRAESNRNRKDFC